ncbi:hypothetical protein HJG60_011828 [Phyllostomus discolor]|uniref:Uncharacterized protein n=1 Tax=Phyllostomus discolor TaxID=89673 RepID=A0A833ZNR6_9CHIR|nr:hypothetical protein HJG60_011828 [Phyllostomus discolor]
MARFYHPPSLFSLSTPLSKSMLKFLCPPPPLPPPHPSPPPNFPRVLQTNSEPRRLGAARRLRPFLRNLPGGKPGHWTLPTIGREHGTQADLASEAAHLCAASSGRTMERGCCLAPSHPCPGGPGVESLGPGRGLRG